MSAIRGIAALLRRIAALLRREPVRAWLYGVALAAMPLLVFLGYVTVEASPLWLALIAAIVVPVEVARSKVTPVAEIPESTYVPRHSTGKEA